MNKTDKEFNTLFKCEICGHECYTVAGINNHIMGTDSFDQPNNNKGHYEELVKKYGKGIKKQIK